jgi:hypothetical protein
MREENDRRNNLQALREQLGMVEKLRALPFDDPSYGRWRSETGRILDQVFGKVESEEHPCTRAFLSYNIPANFTATRAEMQEYYRNILQYQTELLGMYLEDMKD